MAGKAKKAMRIMGVTPDATALIGDQVFTDIWCGKRLKVKTILVKPISNKDFITVRIKRVFEKSVVSAYLKKQAQAELGK